MSVSAMKCFKALFSAETSIHSTSAHVMIAELVSSLVFAKNHSPPNIQAIRALMTTVVDLIEHRPRDEGSSYDMSRLLKPNVDISSMTLLLPELAVRSDIVNQNEDWRMATVSSLLRVAALNPAVFKTVLGSMDVDRRTMLELMLRFALEGNREVQIEEPAKPSISLTLDFASIE
jgi:hypothetical protein